MKYSAILALASAVNAHMIMKTPTPYNAPDSSPLVADGTNFPCKAAGGAADLSTGPVNAMVRGQAQKLSFTGSAVHGGGSCQVSIAKTEANSLKVDASTKWMVIHSIEGGCPADTTSSGGGNLPADPNGSGAATFEFTIPDHPDIPNGPAVLAWTWNNRIGNREMYMNCASIDISGGSAKKRYAPASYSKRQQSALPDMFVANIGNGCTVPEGGDVQYPNPGSSLETGKDFKPMQPVGNCGSSGSSAPSQPSAAVSASTGAAASTANTVVPVPTGSTGPISQSVGGGFATVPASGGTAAPTAAATSAPVAAQPSVSAASSSAVAQPSAPAAASSSTPATPAAPATPATGATGSCTTGDWDCAADGKSFTRCIAGGTWSASIQMSQGLSCTPGISADFAYNLTGSGTKRDLRNHIMHRRNNFHGAISS